MKIIQLNLFDYRGVRDELALTFSERLTVLAGVNGAGKSTILDALATSLSWVVNRISTPTASGKLIPHLDINNKHNFASIILQISKDSTKHSWTLTRHRPAYQSTEKSSLIDATRFAETVRYAITQSKGQCSIPLFAYYPVNRAVLDIPLRIRKKHDFELLAAYDQALGSGASFKLFFEWFRNREDLENEYRSQQNGEYRDRQLEAVRRALKKILPDFTGISVRRSPLRMIVFKQGEELRIDQLSDGEKCLIAMVGDLARRLAIANPTMENPLDGEGVILIDEIDLHLHPKWQRMIVPGLLDTFPTCQFIVSTHSPQVIGEVEPQDVRCLSYEPDEGLRVHNINQAIGLDDSEIIEGIMGASTRNQVVNKGLKTIFRLIDEDKFDEARQKIEELKNRVHGSVPDIVRAETMISMLSDIVDEG